MTRRAAIRPVFCIKLVSDNRLELNGNSERDTAGDIASVPLMNSSCRGLIVTQKILVDGLVNTAERVIPTRSCWLIVTFICPCLSVSLRVSPCLSQYNSTIAEASCCPATVSYIHETAHPGVSVCVCEYPRVRVYDFIYKTDDFERVWNERVDPVLLFLCFLPRSPNTIVHSVFPVAFFTLFWRFIRSPRTLIISSFFGGERTLLWRHPRSERAISYPLFPNLLFAFCWSLCISSCAIRFRSVLPAVLLLKCHIVNISHLRCLVTMRRCSANYSTR